MAKEIYNTYLFSDSYLGGYWRQEGNGNDSTSNSYNMTSTNVSWGTSYGKFNQGASFNGSNSIQRRANTLQLTGNFSLSCWVYFNNVASDQTLIVNELTGSSFGPYYLQFKQSSGSKFSFWVVGTPSGNAEIFSTTSPSTGQWYFITATRDGTNINLYVNGILEAQTAWSTTQTTNSGNYLQFGGTQNAGGTNFRLLNGYLDDIAIFSRALTPSEVLFLYKEGGIFFHNFL